MALPAASAERRPCINGSVSPARRANSSKPAAAHGGTDRRTDTVHLHRPC